MPFTINTPRRDVSDPGTEPPPTKNGPAPPSARFHVLRAAPAFGGDSKGGGVHGYVPAISAEDEANDESCVPWGPEWGKTAEPSNQAQAQACGSLRDDDSDWIEVSACLCSY